MSFFAFASKQQNDYISAQCDFVIAQCIFACEITIFVRNLL